MLNKSIGIETSTVFQSLTPMASPLSHLPVLHQLTSQRLHIHLHQESTHELRRNHRRKRLHRGDVRQFNGKQERRNNISYRGYNPHLKFRTPVPPSSLSPHNFSQTIQLHEPPSLFSSLSSRYSPGSVSSPATHYYHALPLASISTVRASRRLRNTFQTPSAFQFSNAPCLWHLRYHAFQFSNHLRLWHVRYHAFQFSIN